MFSGSPAPAEETEGSGPDALVHAHLDVVGRVVAGVSSRYPRHVDRGELWNAGALGLVEAAKRFDRAAGIPFDRYAAIRIRGAIIDSTRSRDWAPRSVRRRYREVEDARAELAEETGRTPQREEVATRLGIPPAELDRIQARSMLSMLVHLDYASDGAGSDLRDLIVEESSSALPEKALEQRELFGALRQAVEALPDTHREVVRRHYLDGELLQDIASDLGVTQARISQIRSEAVTSLRAWFGTLYTGVPDVDAQAPGKRARAAYVAELAAQSTWRIRMDAAEDERPALMVHRR